MIAYSQGKELFEETTKQFFISSQDPYVKSIFKNFVEKTYDQLVNNYYLKSWKECVGMILSSIQNQKERIQLFETLA